MNLPAHIRYLAIEGVIGVGKTSLVDLIAERLDVTVLKEQFEDNPFLEKFYHEREAWAFQTQLFFLLSRHRQLQDAFTQHDLFRPLVVSDYTVEKDRIFAVQNLNEDEMAMYDTVAQSLTRDLVKPDFVVYLQASINTLQERIEKRGRSFEKHIEGNYLRDLTERYNHHFFHYDDAPVLIVNTDDIDFVDNPNDLEELLTVIEGCPPGMTFYAPKGH